MSELISVLGGEGQAPGLPLPNDLSREYEQINFKVDKNGRPLWFGEYDGSNKRLKADFVLKAFGHDPTEKFNPQPAVAFWNVNGTEMPVFIDGIHGVEDGVTYYKIQGSSTGVPLSKLRWLKPADETSSQSENGAGPIIESLKNEVEELRTVVEGFKTTIEEMKTELGELKQENAELEVENEELRRHKDRLEAVLYQNGIEIPGAEDSTEEVVTVEPLASERRAGRIRPKAAEVEEPVMVETVTETPVPDEEDWQVEPNERPSRWNRASGRIGNAILGYQVKAHNGIHNLVNRNGRVVVEDVETYGYPLESERAGALAVGALAVGAVVGGVVSYLIWGRHGSHVPNAQLHEIINQNKHLKTEVHNMHQALNHDSKIIRENQGNHKILLHNRAELKHLHEQVHTLQKIERSELATGTQTSAANGKAELSYRGDTVWHETARHLRGASAEKIRKATAYVLRINGLRWNGGGFGVDAHRLPVGFRFRIPSNIAEIASR